MRILIFFFLTLLGSLVSAENVVGTTSQVLQDIYYRCADSNFMISCMKPKVLAYLSKAIHEDKVSITEDLSIVRSRQVPEDDFEEYYSSQDSVDLNKKELLRSLMLEKVDAYLAGHRLEVKLPEAIVNSNIVPRALVESIPREINVSLTDSETGQGRGFVKKVMIPFLLGLKFKASVLVPLVLALIAMKTWKALTFGLLSLVLSGAMMIFKLTKPKIAYEVVHYGHSPVEHSAPHWDTAPQGPYRAYSK